MSSAIPTGWTGFVAYGTTMCYEVQGGIIYVMCVVPEWWTGVRP